MTPTSPGYLPSPDGYEHWVDISPAEVEAESAVIAAYFAEYSFLIQEAFETGNADPAQEFVTEHGQDEKLEAAAEKVSDYTKTNC